MIFKYELIKALNQGILILNLNADPFMTALILQNDIPGNRHILPEH